MILNHIAQSTGSIIVSSAVAYTDFLRSCDFYSVYITPIPHRLKKSIGKPGYHNILNRFFAKIMVDPVNLMLKKSAVKFIIQFHGSFVTVSKRFFHYQTLPSGSLTIHLVIKQMTCNNFVHKRWNREIINNILGYFHLFAKSGSVLF